MRRLICVFVLALVVSAPAFAQTVTVTADRTNLRDKPSTDGAVVVAVTKGDELEVLERSGTWYRVRVRSTGREGYVSALLVSAASGGTAPAAPAPTAAPAAPAAAPTPAPPPDTGGGSMAQMSSGGSSGGSGFAITLKGGLQFSKIDIAFDGASDDDLKQDRKAGLIGGVAFRIPLSESFAIQPEALLSVKGSQTPDDEDGWVKITYLELPVLATLRFSTGSVAPFVSVGPALALKLNAAVSRDDENDIEEFIKSSDVGLVVAAGLDIGRLGIEARYTHGLANIFDDADLGVGDTGGTLKNRSFAIMAGFTF